MSKNIIVILIVAVALLSCGCTTASFLQATPNPPLPTPTAPATPNTFSISGIVRDQTGAPVPNAKVSLTMNGFLLIVPNNPQYTRDGSSGDPGRYAFNDLQAGEYTVVAEKAGGIGTLRYSGSGPADIFLTSIGTPTPGGQVTPTQPPDTQSDYVRDYRWTYKGKTWTTSLSIPKSLYRFYKDQPHNRQGSYAPYALSGNDKATIKNLVDMFRDAGSREGYSDYDNVLFIVSFVQSLPYASDKATTGYDEYPRYPVETLVDDGGDCDDTSILAAAMLNEMGYEVALLETADHMAIGVKLSGDYPGTYAEYEGSKYYYIETTGQGWKLGQVPDDYKDQKITVYPMVQVPEMDMNFSADLNESDPFYAYYRVHCDVMNAGTGTARNVSVYVAALSVGPGEHAVWPVDGYVPLGDIGEGNGGATEVTVRIPRNKSAQIECILSGDNFESLIRTTNPFDT